MKYLKLFEKYNEIWELREDLYLILLDIRDIGYDFNIFSHYDSKDNLNQIGVIIKSEGWQHQRSIIDINSEFVSCLKEAISFMNVNGYHYLAKYQTWHSLPQKFNINQILEKSPNCFKISIDFYRQL